MSSMGGDTEEYQKILTRYDAIIHQLASARCSGVLADKLRSKKLITGEIYEEALNFAPGVVESTRIRPMINAVLAKVELNADNYYIFIGVLQEIDGIEDTVQYVEAPLQQLGLQTKCPVSGPGTATEWSATWDASGRFLPIQNSSSLPANQAPPLRVLIQLPVAMKWYHVGLQLGVRANVLDMIKAAFSQNTNMCKMMFAAWLRDDINPTYEKLVKALAAVGHEDLAEYICATRVNQTPSLQVLTLLPVTAQWYDLGLHLGLMPDLLDAIRKTSKHESKLCKLMFTVWLRDDQSPTYEKLARALAAVGKRNLAEPLLAARGVPLSVIQDIAAPQPRAKPTIPRAPPPPECVAKYAKYLKDKYKRMSVLPDGDWPPSIGRHYARLALVENPRELLPDAEFTSTMERDYLHGKIDKIVGRKKEIQVPEIFTESPGETQLKILMDGAPGVGKTTLSRKMAGDWASGVLLEQFHLVILLHLRDPRVRKARSIKDLFPSDGPQFQQDVIQHIKDTAGAHVLFIFDAYDELSYEERTCNSLFLDIIEGRSLYNCSVLVTSRPYASDHLQQLNCINRHVEVLGFTKEQIENCIWLAIPDEENATSLVNLLQERMDIISLCYTPLNCAIMLYVYKQEQYTLPDTLTGLYEAFIVNSLKKNARNLSTFEQRLLKSATSLRGIPKSVKKQLDILSKLASEGLSEDKMIFSYMDVISAFSDYVDANVEENFLGLMTGFSRTSHTDYQFIHLSVQEFLAARWAAAQLSDDEQVVYFHGHMNKDRFRFMLIFLAGVSKLNFQHANQILSAPIDLRCSKDGHISPSKVHFFFFILHLIFETKNLSLYQALKTAVTDHAINICWYKLTAFDCVLLAHFLHWSNCSWKLLNLYGCGLTDHSLEILHKVSLSQPSSTTCIEVVDLSYCSFSTLPQIRWFENTSIMTVKGAPVEFDIVHSVTSMKRLHDLRIVSKETELAHYRVESDTTFSLIQGNLKMCMFSHILKIPNMKYLVKLDLSRNNTLFQNCTKCSVTRESALGALQHFLKTSTCLLELVLSSCGLSDNDIEHITVGLADSVSVQELDISGNRLSGRAIGNVSTKAGSVTHLNLSHCGLSDNDLVPGFSENRCIRQLNISENQLSAEGIISILNSDNAVSYLVIGNQFGNPTKSMCATDMLYYIVCGIITMPSTYEVILGGISGIGRVRISSSARQILKIIRLFGPDEFTVEGCKYIFSVLEKTSAKFTLNLSNCRISDDIVKNIGVGLTENKSLRALDVSVNDIHSDGAVSIFTSLEHNTSLEELDLSKNRELTESDSEAVGWALEKMMTVNCTLKVLHLDYCGLNAAVLYHLATGLTHATGITELDISNNCTFQGRTDSWKQFFMAFHHNSSVKKLDINGNTLGLAKTEALAEMLACNKSLTELNVSGCYWSGAYKAELEVLARGLVNNTTLQRLAVGPDDVMQVLVAKINETAGCITISNDGGTTRIKIISTDWVLELI